MEVEEARGLLGIDATADAKAVRRAYLRALKKHKPERDPAGFQRVREAFELCTRFVPYDYDVGAPVEPPPPEREAPLEPPPERAASYEPEPPMELGPSTEREAPLAPMEREPPTEREAPLAPMEREPPMEREAPFAPMEREPPFEPYEPSARAPTEELEPDPEERRWRRYDALSAELEDASPDERVRALRDALAEDPDDGELRYWLFDELLASDAPREAAEVAREGAARGLVHFRATLAAELPAELTDAELDALKEEAPDSVFRELLRRGRVEELVPIAERSVDAFVENPHRYVGGVLENVLATCAAGRSQLATTMVARIERALEDAGLGTQLTEWEKVQWLLVRELVAALPSVPEELSKVLARAWIVSGLENAEADVRAFAKAYPQTADEALFFLRRHAPTLADIVGPWLESQAARPRLRVDPTDRVERTHDEPPPASPVPVRLIVMIAAMALIGILRLSGSGCLRSRSSSPSWESPPPVTQLSEALRICGMDEARCHDALRLEETLRSGDCAAARAPARALSEDLAPLDEAEPYLGSVRQRIERLMTRYEARCGSEP